MGGRKSSKTDSLAVADNTEVSGRRDIYAFAAAAGGVGMLFLLFWDTAVSFIPIWETDGFGHGYLIIPISVFLAWLCRHRAMAAPVRPSIVGAILLFLMSLVWGLAELVDVNVARQLAFVGMIQLLVLAVLGWPVVRTLIFPLGYLVFAVPFGEFLIPPLQDVTAWVAVGLLQVIGVPTYIDGIFIETPAGKYLVAEACAGLRYLLSTLAISVLAAGLFFETWHKRILFVVAGILVSILANALRAAVVILLAYWIDPSMAGPIHITYGMIFVGIITLIYLFVGASFKDRTVGEYVAMPLPARTSRSPVNRPSHSIAFAAAVILLVAVPSNYVRYAMAQDGILEVAAPAAPVVRAPWTRSETSGDLWQPRFKGASSEVLQGYRSNDQSAELFIGYYATQKPGAELVSSGNKIENEQWQRAGGGSLSIDIDKTTTSARYERLKPKRFNGNTSELSGRVVWYWYWVGGEFTGDPMHAKLLEAWATLTGKSRSAAIIAVSAGYRDKPSEAIDTLNSFIEQLGPLEQGLLRTTNS